MNSEWESNAWDQIRKRNAKAASFAEVFQSHNIVHKKAIHLQQKHLEIRNLIGIIVYDIQESINSGTQLPILNEVKVKLSHLQDDLSPRSTKSYDDLKIRIELANQMKQQERDIMELKQKCDAAQKELSLSQGELSSLKQELESSRGVSLSIQKELDSVRQILYTTEARVAALENENAQFAERLVIEKQKNIDAMNDMIALNSNNPTANEGNATTPSVGGAFMSLFGALGGKSARRKSESIVTEGVSDVDSGHVTNDDFVDVRKLIISNSVPPKHPVAKIQCHNTEINDVVSNQNVFITAAANSSVKIFDLTTHEMKRELHCGGPVISLDMKENWLIGGSSDNAARIWNLQTGELRHHISGHANKVNSARLVGSGRQFAITGSADRTIRCWDLLPHHATAVSIFKCPSSVESVGASSDCSTIASGHHDGSVRIWNLQTKSNVHELSRLHNSKITCVQFDPKNGHYLLTASRDDTLNLIDTRTYNSVLVCRAPGLQISCNWSQASFSPDSTMIAVGSADGSLYVWDTTHTSPKLILQGHKNSICSVFWGDNGVISCDKGGEVILW